MTLDLEKARACAVFVEPKEAFLEALAEIERLRAENAGLSKAVIDAQEERDLAQAEFRTYHKAWEEQAARIQELEEALAEYRKLGKTIAGKVPCLTLHGDCGRCSAQTREVCGALEQIAGGKIGPDAALKKQWDEVLDEAAIHKKMEELPTATGAYRPAIREEAIRQLGAKPRSWQITDERKAAIQHILMCHHCRYDDSGCKASDVLRAMLEAGQ